MAAKTDNRAVISIGRPELSERLQRISRCVKPRAKDSFVRKSLYISPGAGAVSIFATSESIGIMYRDLACTVDGEFPDIAVDLTQFVKFVSGGKGDVVQIMYSDDSAKLGLKCGPSTAKIGFFAGDDYREYVAEPFAYPDDPEMYSHLEAPDKFDSLMGIMVKCSDPTKPVYNGVWTDGEGAFVSSDRFKAMRLSLDQYQLNSRGVVPSDFLGLIKAFGDESIHAYWQGAMLWARNEDAGTVVWARTVTEATFPSEELGEMIDDAIEANDLKILLNARELDDALKRLFGFFGEAVVCEVTLGPKGKMTIVGNNSNGDAFRESIGYQVAEDSVEVSGEKFSAYFSSLALIPDLFDGDLVLALESSGSVSPIVTVAEDLGISYILMQYRQE